MNTHGSPFPNTRWTLVQRVQEGTPEDAAKALEEICTHYWFPIYAYLRCSGRKPHEAEDLTQAFFERLIEGDVLQAARRDRGKLRTFLLTVLTRLLSDLGRRDRAQKRGGGVRAIPFEEMNAEERYAREPRDVEDPEKIYLHAWASGLLDGVRDQLRAAFEKEGRLEMFEAIRPWIDCEDDTPPYAKVATTLGSTEGATRLLVHRLRKKFRALLEEEIAHTVTTPGEVEEELAWLRKAVAK